MANWIIKAILEKNSRLAVALADSVPLVVSEDVWGLGTREMTAGGYTENKN